MKLLIILEPCLLLFIFPRKKFKFKNYYFIVMIILKSISNYNCIFFYLQIVTNNIIFNNYYCFAYFYYKQKNMLGRVLSFSLFKER
jgi:hypothetical protein